MNLPQFEIWRKCPKTGYRETIIYTGSICDIPQGWKRILFPIYAGAVQK